MKLYGLPASPFARKVVACAVARDLGLALTPAKVNPTSPEVQAANPLGKIPALLLDDGTGLYDSPVICEYLDHQGNAPKLFPPAGPTRWTALRRQALADGLMDAAVLRRGEAARPQETARDTVIARQKSVVELSLDAMENDIPGDAPDIGAIAYGCALGYLDFRYADEPWRTTHPRLAVWYERFSKQPCMLTTQPS